MTQGVAGYSCPAGFPVERLMEYLEADPGTAAREEVKRHLEECPDCAAEIERLRRMDELLAAHPFVFHPDPNDVYEYATSGADQDGLIAEHTAECDACSEMVTLFKETADSTPLPESRPRMPASLRRELEAIYPGPDDRSEGPSRFRRILNGLRHSFSGPSLAFGAAVAVVLVAALVLPFWRTWKDHARNIAQPVVEEAPAPIEERPSPQMLERGDQREGRADERFEAASEVRGRIETRTEARRVRPAPPAERSPATAGRPVEPAPRSAARKNIEERPAASSVSGVGREAPERSPPPPFERQLRIKERAGDAAVDASEEPKKPLRRLEQRLGAARQAEPTVEGPLGYRRIPSRERPARGAPPDRAAALSDDPRASHTRAKRKRGDSPLEMGALCKADKENPQSLFSVDLDVKRVGERYVITLRLIDSGTGEEVGRIREEGIPTEELGNRAAMIVRSLLEKAVGGAAIGGSR